MENNIENQDQKPSNKKFIIVLAALILGGGAYGIYKYNYSQAHQTTDDAQVEQNMNPIIPKVSGYVEKVYVKDNQMVKKGDTLLTIESADFDVKVAEANAALLAAQNSYNVALSDNQSTNVNVNISRTGIDATKASIEAAKIMAEQAKNDLDRYTYLYNKRSIPAQDYEKAKTAKLHADQQVRVLQEQLKTSIAQEQASSSRTDVAKNQMTVANANIEKAKAALKAAELNKSYTVITAAIDGQVSAVKTQNGQLVNAGQSLFYIIDNRETWVVANFKETQVNKMRLGQKVDIKVDAFPNTIFEGEINSFSPATGAKFSLLPPDNATGNFVKTVQRLPVKITLTAKNDKEKVAQLRPGMNADVDVNLK